MTTFFISTADGRKFEVEVGLGKTILDACRKAQLPLEGLCGGEMDCSTCHVIVDPAWSTKLAAPTEDEEDMLDLIATIQPTSRLGCQIVASERTDGLAVTLPPSPAS